MADQLKKNKILEEKHNLAELGGGQARIDRQHAAGRKTARADRMWCPRLFLHASEIEIAHPLTGKMISFSSNLDEKLASSLKVLREE